MSKNPISYLRTQARGGNLLLGPEHPLLIRPPQALFSRSGNLCAIFWAQAGEQANPAHLAARLIDARLGLPSECRMILVIGRGEDERHASALRSDFNIIVTEGDRALAAFLLDASDLGTAKAPEAEIKEVARARFGVALATSQQTFREARVRTRGREPELSWTSSLSERPARRALPIHGYAYTPRNVFESTAGTVSLLDASRRPGLARQLRNAADSHLLDSWILDTGVPIPVITETRIAVASHGLDLLRPREALLTAAAFAGVAVSPLADEDVVQYAFWSAKRARSSEDDAAKAMLS